MIEEKEKKILVVSPAWIGDMVMAQSLFQLLKMRDENCVIDVLAPESMKDLLERMPEVRQTISLNIAHGELGLKKRFEMAKTLRDERYSCAYVLPNSWKSALIPFLARIPKRIGFKGEWRYVLLNDLRILDEKALPLMIARFVSLGLKKGELFPEDCPMPQLVSPFEVASQTLEKLKLNREKPVLVLCPGAEYGEAKRWPAEYFAQVANVFLQKEWQVWILGSKKDGEIAKEINSQTQMQCQDLSGETNLAEAVDVMSVAKVVVTNDSGLMHIACALALPVIALFGSSSSDFTPPLNEKAKALSLNLDCSPCFKRVCPLKYFKCMQDLKPQMVIDAVTELVSS